MSARQVRCVGCAERMEACAACWGETAREQEREEAWRRHHERWMREGAEIKEVG
jgi:hypothetical protein